MKIRPVGAELLHADGWSDTHDATNSVFPQFYEGACEIVQTVTHRIVLSVLSILFFRHLFLRRLPWPVCLNVGNATN
jgi:hypothetical protein